MLISIIIYFEVRELPSLYVYIFCVVVSEELFCMQSYDIKYSNLIQIICTQLYGFKYFYIILIIVEFQVFMSNTNNYLISINFLYLIIIICLHAVI